MARTTVAFTMRGSPAGGTSYAYDALGRVTSITYTYDALNRLTSRTSDAVADSFFYDVADPSVNGDSFSLTNTLGRLSYVKGSGGNATSVYSYDAMGRVQDYWTCSPVFCADGTIHPSSGTPTIVMTWRGTSRVIRTASVCE